MCGGRDFVAEQFLKETLCDLVWCRKQFEGLPQVTTIIHGGARGVDKMAGNFAIGCNLVVEEYKADWATHGKAAGPIRNQQMLDQGKPNLVIAFPGGRGTADMVARAKKAGVEVKEIKYGNS